MTDQATSFGQAAGTYDAGRPGYPREAVEFLLAPATAARAASVDRPLRVADVGAGTGKLTRSLRETGAEVVAVDPDPDMLAQLRESVPGVPTLVGSAEHLSLPEASVDAVVLGQAWHWVDVDAASAEIGRVLRPGGVLGLIWNIRDESVPWVARLTEIVRGSNAEKLIAGGGPRVGAPFGDLESRTWQWSRPITRAGLLDLVHSRSYIITASADERARVDREIGELCDELGVTGEATTELPYVTHAYRAVR